MLENIKSIFFIRIVFLHLNDENKLKLVKYNKGLKNKLDINLINYILFSRRYIKYESNGIAKEYSSIDNRLKFEGEYSNGKRNGKGKEYYEKCQLKFEGEFLNGKRNGKGKEYYLNGKRRFEGEYLNGKKWNGTGYSIQGIGIYKIKDGKGMIKEYDKDGKLFYVGHYINGERNGKGKIYNVKKQLSFEGELLNGKVWNGKGYESKKNILYYFKL